MLASIISLRILRNYKYKHNNFKSKFVVVPVFEFKQARVIDYILILTEMTYTPASQL